MGTLINRHAVRTPSKKIGLAFSTPPPNQKGIEEKARPKNY